MRKLFMAVAILGISATVSFAKAQCVNENGNKEPFAVEFGKLSSKYKVTSIFHDFSHCLKQNEKKKIENEKATCYPTGIFNT